MLSDLPFHWVTRFEVHIHKRVENTSVLLGINSCFPNGSTDHTPTFMQAIQVIVPP